MIANLKLKRDEVEQIIESAMKQLLTGRTRLSFIDTNEQ